MAISSPSADELRDGGRRFSRATAPADWPQISLRRFSTRQASYLPLPASCFGIYALPPSRPADFSLLLITLITFNTFAFIYYTRGVIAMLRCRVATAWRVAGGVSAMLWARAADFGRRRRCGAARHCKMTPRGFRRSSWASRWHARRCAMGRSSRQPLPPGSSGRGDGAAAAGGIGQEIAAIG